MKVNRVLKDGKKIWNIDVSVRGERIRASSTKSRQDCIEKYEQKIQELEKKEKEREASKKRIRKLRNSITDWYDRYRGTINGFTRATTSGNNGVLRAICNSGLGNMRVCEITKDDIQDWLLDMSDLAYNTRRNRFYLLKSYFESEFQTEPQKNPCLGLRIPRERSKKEKMVVLDDAQMKRLEAELSKPRDQSNKEDPGYFNGGHIIVLMYQFLRISELCGLQRKDIDLDNMTMTVRQQYSYGKDDRDSGGGREFEEPKYGSVRELPIFPPAVPWIKKAYMGCKDPDDFLFKGIYGKPINVNSVRNTLNKSLERCGLPHIRIHDLRHTGISFLLRHGVPVESVSEWAGHSSTMITQTIYYTVVKDQINAGTKKAMEIWENE